MTITTATTHVRARRQQRRVILPLLFLLLLLLGALAFAAFTHTSSTTPTSSISFEKKEKIKKDDALLSADDAGFLNPDEEESTKVSTTVIDEVGDGVNEEEEEEEEEELDGGEEEVMKLGDDEPKQEEDENEQEEEDENEQEDDGEVEVETKEFTPKTKKITTRTTTTTTTTTTTRSSRHSHVCSPEYIALFPPKAKASKPPQVSTLAHRKNYANTGAYRDKKIPASILPNSGKDILAAPAVAGNSLTAANGDAPWRTCALVGNSGHLLKMDYGKQIDANDVVVRINQAPTKGYEKYVGKKTTHRLLNRLWTIAYHDGSGINKIYRGGGWPLEKGVTLISSRTAAENFVRLAYYVKDKLKRKDVQTLFLMPEVRAVAENALKKFRRCYEKKHSKNFRGGNCASSGLVGIAMLRPLCMNITVYGLGKGQRGDPYQYYRLKRTHRSYGNPVHSFDTEDIMFRTMANDGFITFCNAKDGCS